LGYTKELAQFATQLKYSDLPAPVIEKAKELALHAWGVQLAGSTLPWAKSALRYAQGQGGFPVSTVLNYGDRTSSVNAAFANGTFGHGFEMDDNHASAGTKGGCVAVPALLAIGEQRHSTGTDFITAMVVAYELMIRISLSLQPDLLHGSHHATSTCAPLGTAPAVGKLFGFDEQLTMHALSIGASHAAGITEAPAIGRGTLKRIFGGMTAANSVRAALLALEGITAPETTLEGGRGFCHGFSREPKFNELTAGLGSKWHMLDVHYKIYAQD
jgi:2-methylcitrate dehydratase PrpD